MDSKDRKARETERPVPPGIYPVIDTDLARDNIENDLPAADLEDLRETPASPLRPRRRGRTRSWQTD